MADLAIIILTYNEELHLERALDHVLSIAKEIFIVDSYSTDRTIELANSYGDKIRVLQNPFINQAKQFQWAMDNAPITAGWVMRLDADEIIEAGLASKIETELPKLSGDVVGINLKRKTIFLGRWIRYGGRYPLVLLRIWRKGHAKIEDRWMDEHITVSGGRVMTFDGGFADHNLNDLSFFIEKHNKYASREAVEILNAKYELFGSSRALSIKGTSRQVAAKRFVKENIYNRIPFEIAAFGYYFYRYVIRAGFLDGREGLSYHFLQCCWYRFLVGAKAREFDLSMRSLTSAEDRRMELSRLTGLKLDALKSL